MTRDELRQWLRYNPATGVFTWKVQRRGGVRAGSIAGRLSHGYIRIHVGKVEHAAHRLAWLDTSGEWPTGEIDHINGVKSDNRFANLRMVSHRLNMENQRRARANSKLGLLGVSQSSRTSFYARIHVNGRRVHLGSFSTAEAARRAYLTAKRALHAGNTL